MSGGRRFLTVPPDREPSRLDLEFGHSGAVNPEGCQTVAGGRRGFFQGGDLRATAQERPSTPGGVPDSLRSGVLEIGVAHVQPAGTPFGHGFHLLQRASMMEAVRQYIAAQEEHHRTRPFDQELRELLEKHQVQYDPRYLL